MRGRRDHAPRSRPSERAASAQFTSSVAIVGVALLPTVAFALWQAPAILRAPGDEDPGAWRERSLRYSPPRDRSGFVLPLQGSGRCQLDPPGWVCLSLSHATIDQEPLVPGPTSAGGSSLFLNLLMFFKFNNDHNEGFDNFGQFRAKNPLVGAFVMDPADVHQR